ncbi:hypothetical protein MRX96_029145 [Rhipicephalus microplus]
MILVDINEGFLWDLEFLHSPAMSNDLEFLHSPAMSNDQVVCDGKNYSQAKAGARLTGEKSLQEYLEGSWLDLKGQTLPAEPAVQELYQLLQDCRGGFYLGLKSLTLPVVSEVPELLQDCSEDSWLDVKDQNLPVVVSVVHGFGLLVTLQCCLDFLGGFLVESKKPDTACGVRSSSVVTGLPRVLLGGSKGPEPACGVFGS